MKKPVSVAAVAALVGALALIVCQPAAAATYGNNCAGLFAPGGTAYSLSAPLPAGGVITSWTAHIETQETEGISWTGQLKVLRTVGPGKLEVIGESHSVGFGGGEAEPFYASSVTRIPVRKGDFLADTAVQSYEGDNSPQSVTCERQPASSVVATVAGEPTLGQTSTSGLKLNEAAVPVGVELEPDADGDGFGDLTQDVDSGNPFLHASCSRSPKSKKAVPCLRPAASPLRLRAVPHEEAVNVSVGTTTAAAVSVSGRVEIGKRSVPLSAAAEQAKPGASTKYVLPLPGAVRSRLARMSPKQSLRAEVIATAPGLEPAKPVTVKLRGEASPAV